MPRLFFIKLTMHLRNNLLPAVLLALAVTVRLPAQATATPTPDAAADAAKIMADGLKVRGDIADAIAGGSTKVADAITLLRASTTPSGLKLDADADFAFAAIDIGQRLIVAGKPVEAELVFTEAQKALVLMVNKTPDSAAHDKALYLQKLAFIRAQYLNNAAQAKADLDAAQLLQPDDKYLQQFRDVIASDKAQVFKVQPKG